MIPISSLLVLGFLLGMRHATDADHVVAVSTIVGRSPSLRGAVLLGSLWGAGHTATVLVVGGAIVVFDLVIPPRVGLGLELLVGVMLVGLGAWSLWGARKPPPGRARQQHGHGHGHAHAHGEQSGWGLRVARPLAVGTVHGLAGSAAVALLVLGTIRQAGWAVAYLAVFGVGTMAGMALVTVALTVPLRAAERAGRSGRWIGVAAGLASVAMGVAVLYRVGFVDGLFTGHPRWTPG